MLWVAGKAAVVTAAVAISVKRVGGRVGNAANVTVCIAIVVVHVLDASSFLAHVADAVAIIVIGVSRRTIGDGCRTVVACATIRLAGDDRQCGQYGERE